VTAATATRDQPNWLARVAQDHRRAFADAALRLRQNLVASLLTVLVVGVTLALPGGLEALVRSLGSLAYSWESALQASLFLKDSVSPEHGAALAAEIGNKRGVSRSFYISRDAALDEFRTRSGYGDALALLQDNPLPAVIVVTPDSHLSRAAADALLQSLTQLPEVDQARLDQKWVDRLYELFAFARRFVAALAGLLALAVVLIIGNTVRFDVENRREEILVMKQVGATDAYIRRPFLYTGCLYGLFGGLVGCALISAALSLIIAPALAVLDSEAAGTVSAQLSPQTVAAILGAGLLLGVLTSGWAVTRRLRQIEPR